MTVKSSISLTDQQDAFARSLVDNGRYSSLSSVVQQGLDLLRQKTEEDEVDTAALKLLIEQREKGPFVSMDEMKQRTDAMIQKKRRELGISD